MSEKITSSQIYLFLANQGNWNDKDHADIDGDGTITKGEMREFLSSEDFEAELGVSIRDISAKVFNEFWAKIDNSINNNKMDENELDRAMVQVKTVAAIKDKISGCPSGLDADKWTKEVLNNLNTSIINSINNLGNVKLNDDGTLPTEVQNMIDKFLETNADAYNKAKNRATAELYKSTALTEIIKDFPELDTLKKETGYDIKKDDNIDAILTDWIEKNADTFTGNIQDEIKAIIKAYLKTANIGTDGDVSKLDGLKGYSASKLNELQAAKLKNEAQKVFGSSLKTVDLGFTIEGANGAIDLTGGGYDGIYKKYVDEFLKSYFESGYKNATRTDGQSLFEAALNELKTNGMQLFKDSKAGENFITEVQFADNYRFVWEGKDFFKEVLATGIDGVNENGGIVEGSDLANLKAWLNNDIGEGKFPEYYAAYNKIIESILNPYDKTYRKSDGSINYDKINTELTTLVKVKFGILSVDSSGNITGEIQNWSGNNNTLMVVGTSKSFQVTAGLGADFDPSLVTYNAVSSNGGTIKMTNPSKGKFKYTAPQTAGYDKITVNAYYNGNLIGSQTITIEVSEVQGWGQDSSGGHLEVFGAGNPGNGSQVSASNFADLYSNNAIIRLHTSARDHDDDDNKNTAKGRLDNLVDMIVNSLSAGLDPTKLAKAAAKVKQRYKDNLDVKPRINNNWEGNELAEHLTGVMQSESPHQIVCLVDKKNCDAVVFMVSFRNLVDDIIAEYNSLP